MYPNSHYAPSVSSKDPPPSYGDAYLLPASLPGPSSATDNSGQALRVFIDEGEPLLAKHGSKQRRTLNRLSAVLGSILLVIFILQNLSLLSCPLDDVSASAKRARRREWKAQMKEHSVLVEQWAAERELHEQEKHNWADERVKWQEERQKWEEERKNEERHRKEVERMRQGVYWTPPVGEAHCSAYGTRAYRAVLKDIPSDLNWLEVCSDMPIDIHGRPVDRPDDCQRNDRGEVQALWNVNWDEPSCVPYWGEIQSKGCAPGKPGFAHFEARLWGINHGDDWVAMCTTTPAQISGRDFKHPSTCELRGIFGIVGLWEVPNKWC